MGNEVIRITKITAYYFGTYADQNSLFSHLEEEV